MNIRFGERVTSSDLKELGILKELLVQPATREVAYLVVQRGLFFGTDTLVPTEAVAGVTPDGIRLNQTAETISSQVQEISAPETQPRSSLIPPGFVPGEISPPLAAPNGTVSLDHDTPVETSDGRAVGRILSVTTADRRITEIVLKGGMAHPGRTFDAESIGHIEDNRIVLTIPAEALNAAG